MGPAGEQQGQGPWRVRVRGWGLCCKSAQVPEDRRMSKLNGGPRVGRGGWAEVGGWAGGAGRRERESSGGRVLSWPPVVRTCAPKSLRMAGCRGLSDVVGVEAVQATVCGLAPFHSATASTYMTPGPQFRGPKLWAPGGPSRCAPPCEAALCDPTWCV